MAIIILWNLYSYQLMADDLNNQCIQCYYYNYCYVTESYIFIERETSQWTDYTEHLRQPGPRTLRLENVQHNHNSQTLNFCLGGETQGKFLGFQGGSCLLLVA